MSYQQNQKIDNASNFHVCVRIRPTSSASFENNGHQENQKYVRAGPENSILLVQPHSTQGDKVFIFDEVFDQNSKTKDIFDKVIKPNLTDSLFKGFSHTILVYGMTGSGKTYTMFGGNCIDSQQQQGIVAYGSQTEIMLPGQQRISMNTEVNDVDGPLLKNAEIDENNAIKNGLVAEIVKLVLQNQQQQQKTKLKMSYLEIYNEQIRDLLSNEAITADNLSILEDNDKGVYCPLLSEREINNLDQIQQLIKLGNRRRVMASTKINQFSSRSHAIIQLTLNIELDNNGTVTTMLTPKLYMVDLAGSERASVTESKGVRLKEGGNINKSLLSLGNCITVLSSPDKARRHVPYRDSKLTRLLKESLGGNAKTILISCITPAFRFIEETINTLKYAQRAKSIQKEVYENVRQIYNALDKKEEVKEVHIEIENLKELLQQQQYQNAMINACNPEEFMNQLRALGEGASEEELMRRLQNIAALPPNEQQVVASQQFQLHKLRFIQQFNKLSNNFEDVLFRNRELECNLAEHKQAREQNEKLINEIMETINPNQTMKDNSYRLEKVNMLKQLIKNNDDVVNRLLKERQDNQQIIELIKKELSNLYEFQFIQQCKSLSNMELYSQFEQDKKVLQAQIDQLLTQQQIRREDAQKKDMEIQFLKDDIANAKKKAAHTELILQQQQELLKSKSVSRGRYNLNNNLRSQTYIQNSKATPRSNSNNNTTTANNNNNSNNPNNQSSKLTQFSTFVPTTSSSSNNNTAVRNRSANMRASAYNSNYKNSNANEQQNEEIVGMKSMIDVHHNDGKSNSPSTREYEEYRRKEFIIESQLKNLSKNSSSKNVNYGQKTQVEQTNNNSSSSNFQSPNRLSSQAYKSSFKSSFIDLVPVPPSDLFSAAPTTAPSQDNSSSKVKEYTALHDTDTINNNLNNGSYQQQQFQQQQQQQQQYMNYPSYDTSIGSSQNNININPQQNLMSGNQFQISTNNQNLSYSYQPTTFSYSNAFQHHLLPNPNINSLSGSSHFNNSISSNEDNNSQNNYNLRRSELTHQQYQKIIGQEDDIVKRSSFNTDANNAAPKKTKNVTIAPIPTTITPSKPPQAPYVPQQQQVNYLVQGTPDKSYSGVFSPIIESLQEQSMLNTSNQTSEPTPQHFKPKESKFYQQYGNNNNNNNILDQPTQQTISPSVATIKSNSPYSTAKQPIVSNSPYSSNTSNKQFKPYATTTATTSQNNYLYNNPSHFQTQSMNTNINNTTNSNLNVSNNTINQQLAQSYDFTGYNSTTANPNASNKNLQIKKPTPNQNSIQQLYGGGIQNSPGVSASYDMSNKQANSILNVKLQSEEQKPPKVINPSFNNYMQNNATYGLINQSLGITNPKQGVPTTAISLNLENN